MRNKSIAFVFGWIVVAFLVFLTFVILRDNYRESHKNKFEFPTTIEVSNVSSIPYLDTLVMVAVNKIMQYDSMYILISNMVVPIKAGDVQLLGYIQQNPYYTHTYNIYVDPTMRGGEKILFVAHEMIHLNQIESGRLISLPDLPGKIYDGDTIAYYKVPYSRRAFEIDAEASSGSLEQQLRHLIYDK